VFKRRRERAEREAQRRDRLAPPVRLAGRQRHLRPQAAGVRRDAARIQMKLEGFGFRAIAKRLREVAGPMERRAGKLVKWDPSTVSQMICRESYKARSWTRRPESVRSQRPRHLRVDRGVTHELAAHGRAARAASRSWAFAAVVSGGGTMCAATGTRPPLPPGHARPAAVRPSWIGSSQVPSLWG
jgi:hypothetical protein